MHMYEHTGSVTAICMRAQVWSMNTRFLILMTSSYACPEHPDNPKRFHGGGYSM